MSCYFVLNILVKRDIRIVRKELITSGIPYSFVPGTKAKADEVNANFLAVLNKIEETNSAKLNVDLSNIDETGKATLDVVNTKADKKELDGEWQYCHYVLALDVVLDLALQK